MSTNSNKDKEEERQKEGRERERERDMEDENRVFVSATESMTFRAKVLPHVAQIADALGLPQTEAVVGVSATMLSKMVSSQKLTGSAVQHTHRSLSGKSRDSSEFRKRYWMCIRDEESRGGRDKVDKFLMVLARLASEKEICERFCEGFHNEHAQDAEANTTNYDDFHDAVEDVHDDEDGEDGEMEKENTERIERLKEEELDEEVVVAAMKTKEVHAKVDDVQRKKRHSGVRNKKAIAVATQHEEERYSLRQQEPPQVEEVRKPKKPELPTWFNSNSNAGSAVTSPSASMSPQTLIRASHGPLEEPELVQELLTVLLGLTRIDASRSPETLAKSSAARGGKTERSDVATHQQRGLQRVPALALHPSAVDPLLVIQAQRLIDAGECAVALNAFVQERSEYGAGLTAQAAAAGMRKVLADWRAMLVQMEHGARMKGMSVAGAWLCVQPCAAALSALAAGAELARQEGLTGAALLDMLDETAGRLAGDVTAKRLFETVLRSAAAPLMNATREWIRTGRVQDPYGEFMIAERRTSSSAAGAERAGDDWDMRFALREVGVPRAMRNVARMVLVTGKTVDALRECGVPFEAEEAAAEKEAMASAATTGSWWRGLGIGHTYTLASQAFRSHLLHDAGLLECLESVRRYVLLGQGDFLVHFLDSASAELSKPARLVRKEKLASLLELALRTSSAAGDAGHEGVTCTVERERIEVAAMRIVAGEGTLSGDASADGCASSMSGYDALSLDLIVRWPVSLVVSESAMSKYRVLFRHIFSFKRVERGLSRAWQAAAARRRPRRLDIDDDHEHDNTVDTRDISNGVGAADMSTIARYRAILLRGCQVMLHFVQNVLQYITVEVIEPRFRVLLRDIGEAEDVEAVMATHSEFVDACMRDCMLHDPDMHARLGAAQKICLSLSAIAESSCTAAGVAYVPDAAERAEECVLKFREEAGKAVAALERAAVPGSGLAHLVTRLNFNGYYHEQQY